MLVFRSISRAARFPLGSLYMTRGVNDWVADSEQAAIGVLDGLRRHAAGNWGSVDPQDWRSNDYALSAGDLRIVSSYEVTDRTVWIITEADRRSTTILFPDEY